MQLSSRPIRLDQYLKEYLIRILNALYFFSNCDLLEKKPIVFSGIECFPCYCILKSELVTSKLEIQSAVQY